jgi:non-heme Fe2+,alpha-ketoglutarate-dependent halogenase
MPKTLSQDQIAHFKSKGYLFPFTAMTPEEAALCRQRIEAYETATDGDANRTLKIKAHLSAPWLVDLARRPEILDVVEDLIGPNILLFGSSIFAKNGRDSRYVSWHQDSAYFGLNPHEEITVWVGFTESTIEKGCLRVMPETHLGNDMKHVETYAADNMLAKGQSIEGLDESRAVSIELKAGQFSVHHERTAHASGPNRSHDRRIGFAFFFIPTHVASTIGRRKATLVRGRDDFGHWDAEQLPRFDRDPLSMEELSRSFGEYKDGEIKQAADMAVE